jgi:hypothetical protein
MKQCGCGNRGSRRELELNNTIRKLWSQHVMWTRSFIISTAANLGDLQPVTKRLLQNPGDFANELRRFYGDEKAKAFAKLLTEHLLIAAKLVNDAKAGDKTAADADRKSWFQNADNLADFLAEINPYWDRQVWRSMLYDHLKITENEAALRLSGQYAADVALYDNIESQALRMADYMIDGIRRQFHV